MKYRIFFLLLLTNTGLFAQDKLLTVENTVFAVRDGLTPQRLSQLGWITGTNSYYYISKSGATESLITCKADGKSKEQEILSLEQLNALMLKQNITAGPKLQTFPQISWNSPKDFSFMVDLWKFTYSLADKKLKNELTKAYPEKAAFFDEAPVTKYTAYTIDNNLFIRKSGSASSDIAVTSDNEKNIVNGQIVHREEFGISKGTFWSPSGQLLAFYRMDQTMVTDYPILDLTKHPAQVNMIKYPMAGGVSHQVTVGVYNTATGQTVFLATGEPKDQYLTNIQWSPDNQHIFIAVLNRDQNHLWLNSYNASTGTFEKTLFEELDEKYVHPMHEMQFVPGHPDEFIWQSERTTRQNAGGSNQLLLYRTDGTLLNILGSAISPTDRNTAPPVVTDTYGFDKTGKWFYYQAAPFGTCEKHIYAACIELGHYASLQLTSETGTHSAMFSDDKSLFLDDYSSPSVPRIQSLRNLSGKIVKTLLSAPNPLSLFKPCSMRLFTITAADGETPLWCRMFLPANFDSTKQYPSLTYVYNGPNVQLVTNSWLGGADLFLYYMAQQGFVVFTVDGRGSGNRGLRFEQATFRHLGTQEIADQQKGNAYLRSLSYVDSNRMAVYGWSFGGFMTTSLMTRTPGLYKCGVAGGAVIDWSYYEVMYTERYMDTPQANPEGYNESNLLNYAQNLKGKLLQLHGTSDDVVVWQHTLMYTKACVSKGIQTDYYVYPGHLHNVRGKDRVHLLTKVSEYIIANT
jgi:dipeptidyl-peptidase-4